VVIAWLGGSNSHGSNKLCAATAAKLRNWRSEGRRIAGVRAGIVHFSHFAGGEL
jgi:hypothetical protein